jgi:hypothetical protein
MMRSGDDPDDVTAREMQRWLARSLPDLHAARIHADFARGRRLGRRGSASWVSLTSPWASGRLVRATDGSSSWAAHRHHDGAALLDGRSARTSLLQLDTLVDAIRQPDASAAG